MPSQKRKEKEKQKLLQKASQNCLSIKAIFERNKPTTSSHTITHSRDLQNDLQFCLKLSNLRKYPTTITMITYQMKIIESA